MMLGLLQVSGNFRIYKPGSITANVVVPTPVPEVNGKFAPPAGRALFLIGPDKKNVDAYFDAVVTAPGGVAGNTSLQLKSIKDLDYLAGKYRNSTLSVGLDLKGVIADVAAGKADAKIDKLLDVLDSYNRPVFLRLGYGFDDPLNKYEPDIYVSAWKKFRDRMQAKGSTNMALVWESVACDASNIADWYPGDEFVDWVGISYCDGKPVEASLQFARVHLKPVMLEAASQGASWNEWFVSFFKFVQDNNDVVRAVIYDNAGNSRIQLYEEVVKHWQAETNQSFWLRGGVDLFTTLDR